jgi:hypothetical protein
MDFPVFFPTVLTTDSLFRSSRTSGFLRRKTRTNGFRRLLSAADRIAQGLAGGERRNAAGGDHQPLARFRIAPFSSTPTVLRTHESWKPDRCSTSAYAYPPAYDIYSHAARIRLRARCNERMGTNFDKMTNGIAPLDSRRNARGVVRH